MRLFELIDPDVSAMYGLVEGLTSLRHPKVLAKVRKKASVGGAHHPGANDIDDIEVPKDS